MLAQENEVPVAEISRFNAGTMMEHESFYQNLDDGFPSRSPIRLPRIWVSIWNWLVWRRVKRSPRLAMKIAYSEGADKKYPMCSTDELESD